MSDGAGSFIRALSISRYICVLSRIVVGVGKIVVGACAVLAEYGSRALRLRVVLYIFRAEGPVHLFAVFGACLFVAGHIYSPLIVIFYSLRYINKIMLKILQYVNYTKYHKSEILIKLINYIRDNYAKTVKQYHNSCLFLNTDGIIVYVIQIRKRFKLLRNEQSIMIV